MKRGLQTEMKILFVQETDWITRNPIDQHHIAERLSIKGHDFRVIDYDIGWRTEKKGFWAKRQIFPNVTKVHKEATITVIRPGIIHLPLIDYFSLALSMRREIRRQIEEFSPDIIIGLGGIYSYIAGRLAKSYHISFINYWVDIHHRLVRAKIFQFIGWAIEYRTVRLADRVVVVNENLRNYITKLGVVKDKINLLSTGVDIERFDPNIDGTPVRDMFGIKKTDIVLLFSGWLFKFSGLKEVALKLANNDNENIKMIIVGQGEAYGDLIKIQQEYNLDKKLILTGKKKYDDIPRLIAASDICILPAHANEKIMKDIVPIKLYEYAAMRKPIIATKLLGVMARFGNDNGVLYVDKAEEVIDKAIELASSGNIKDIGAKARKFAENYSWDVIVGKFETIMLEVIKEERK